jgi:branched-chain amino acid transport system ATP-binding protein
LGRSGSESLRVAQDQDWTGSTRLDVPAREGAAPAAASGAAPLFSADKGRSPDKAGASGQTAALRASDAGAAPAGASASVVPAKTVAPVSEPGAPATTKAAAGAPKPVAKTGAARAKAARSPASAGDDDLKIIVGIGRANERKLHALDVRRYAQIAAWTAEDQQRIGSQLAFPGRIEREQWVAQAIVLRDGGREAFDKGEWRRKLKGVRTGK